MTYTPCHHTGRARQHEWNPRTCPPQPTTGPDRRPSLRARVAVWLFARIY